MLKETLISLLEQEPLENIVLLKLMRQYPQMELIANEDGSEYGVLLSLPVAESDFYKKLYPQAERVVFPVATESELLGPLLAEYAVAQIILAISDPLIEKLALTLMNLEFVRSYISFSTTELIKEVDTSGVIVSEDFSEECSELFKLNNYSQTELETFASWGAKTFSIRNEAGEIVSACFIFPNYGHVWEIAGLHTKETDRGRGLAKKITAAAANYIVNHGGMVRYQVENTNLQSQQLARSVGLYPFLEIKHFLKRSYENPTS